MNSTPYKTIIPIGMRCHTEMLLKEMGYKKFSTPFDAIFSRRIDDIIYLFKNKIEYDKLIHTENIKSDIILQLNNFYGLRTIHPKLGYYNENDLFNSYHLSTFPHHNLNDIKVREHFERCFKRIENIKQKKIRTLFCIFNRPGYTRNDKFLSLDEINKMKNYLHSHYNCHLLVIEFYKYTDSKEEKMRVCIKDKQLTYIHVNNANMEYNEQKDSLTNIFSNIMNINDSDLLTYDEILL
jgi:hypothetical protein